jgi:CIC family chloride channel protein
MLKITKKLLARIDMRLQLVFVAVIVGICGGVASVLLNIALRWAQAWLQPLRSHWYAWLLPAGGILAAVFLFKKVFRDQGEHGVPEVIYAISKRGGLIRVRTSFSRLITCLFTLAGGGSAGPEAPVVISGASIGSNIASWLRLKDRQRTVIVGCGASSAIAAIFNAPATGIMFTMEAVLGEWTQLNLIPIAVASVVGTEVSRLLRGNQIPFEHRYFNISHVDLLACVALSLLAAAVSVGFVRTHRAVGHGMGKWIPSVWLRACLGGVLVGAIGIFVPEALGEGYHWVRGILSNAYHQGLMLVGIVVVSKIVTTSLTSGAGGIGGVFAPCLVIGAMVGLFFRDGVSALFPYTTFSDQGYYALVGMAAVVSGVLKSPLTGIFLILEITGGYDVLASVVLVSVLSTALSSFFEPDSVYHRELRRRGLLLRTRTDARVLSEIRVTELIDDSYQPVPSNTSLREFARIATTSRHTVFPVEDPGTRAFVGLVTLDTVRAYLLDENLYDSSLVEEFIDDLPTVHPDQGMTEVIQLMDEIGADTLPAVEQGRFLGIISKSSLLDHYRKEMAAQEET